MAMMESTLTKSRTQRPDPATLPPLALSGSRRRILDLLHTYRYLTPRLLGLAYGSSAGVPSHVRHELSTLWKHGLIQRFYDSKRPTGRGSDEYVYTLTLAGGRAVLDGAAYSRHRHRIFTRSNRAQGNYEHHLAITRLQLILSLGLPDQTLQRFRADEHKPESRFSVNLAGRRHTTRPDVWATFALPRARPVYLFEIDTVRKNNPRLRTRFDAYAAFLTSRDAQRMLRREEATYAAAVFVADSETELERMLEHATQALVPYRRQERPQFFFWNMEDWHRERRMEQAGRRWTIRELRKPSVILQAKTVCDMSGRPRWLVPLP